MFYPDWIQVPLLLLLIAAWSLVLKGIALWTAAQRKEKGWFVALLIINTLGILELIYIFAVAKQKIVFPTSSPTKRKE
ncbi:MAG: DUF5652 family protein [Candidatus Andersenbacteria bacterium]